MAEVTTVLVKRETRDRLKKYGFKGETYDEIVNRLIETAERQMFYERQKRILETEEFVPLDEI